MELRFRRLAMILAGLFFILTLGGCGEPLTAYFAAGHDPSGVHTVLVMPFLDARTFREENDPVNATLSEEARTLFVEALKRNDHFAGTEILSPPLVRSEDSMTVSDALSVGRQYNADLVVVGQVFSYTETRAASIPPRAGMFVRFISVPEERLVFVGDHYHFAGAPGAEGGRKKQAELVCDAIIASYDKAAQNRDADGSVDLDDEEMIPSGVANLVPSIGDNVPTVLFLPYHELENPANLVQKTGGGAVVTSLYQMELAKLGSFRLVNARSGQVSSSRLLTKAEALALARELGADYVVRGQVVEFRRAMSVPSLYSVIISTAILAAQVLFAEMSGVDIATEVWRVEDNTCIYAKRESARQKYVVQAEKTVRRLAQSSIPDLASAINNPPAEGVEPVIDSIELPPPPTERVAENDDEWGDTVMQEAGEETSVTGEEPEADEDAEELDSTETVADTEPASAEDAKKDENEAEEPDGAAEDNSVTEEEKHEGEKADEPADDTEEAADSTEAAEVDGTKAEDEAERASEDEQTAAEEDTSE